MLMISIMGKYIQKLRDAIQVVLHTPVRLPLVVTKALQYLGLALGIIEKIIDKDKSDKDDELS